jgi:hypothetical protein
MTNRWLKERKGTLSVPAPIFLWERGGRGCLPFVSVLSNIYKLSLAETLTLPSPLYIKGEGKTQASHENPAALRATDHFSTLFIKVEGTVRVSGRIKHYQYVGAQGELHHTSHRGALRAGLR